MLGGQAWSCLKGDQPELSPSGLRHDAMNGFAKGPEAICRNFQNCQKPSLPSSPLSLSLPPNAQPASASEPHLAGKGVVDEDVRSVDLRPEGPDGSCSQQVPVVLGLEELSQRLPIPLDANLQKRINQSINRPAHTAQQGWSTRYFLNHACFAVYILFIVTACSLYHPLSTASRHLRCTYGRHLRCTYTPTYSRYLVSSVRPSLLFTGRTYCTLVVLTLIVLTLIVFLGGGLRRLCVAGATSARQKH